MSETDAFIREVTEEVRQDRMFRLWKKYGPYGIAAVVAIVAISAGINWYRHHQIETAREAGGVFLAAAIDSVTEQEAVLASAEGPARAVAKMRLAAAKAAAGDAEGAAALYREVAADSAAGPAYADLARLQGVRVMAAQMDSDSAVAELAPLLADDAPYRLLALELRAAILMNSGATEAAQADLVAILQDPEATRSLRERAGVTLLSSGGKIPAAE